MLKFKAEAEVVKMGLAKNANCTGCGACVNLCAANAICLKADETGFLKVAVNENKCTGCGKCANMCPQVYKSFRFEQNCDLTQEYPHSYAFMASDEVRLKSSSGGAFTLAAVSIFEQGGVVAGVAWNKEVKAEFRIINSAEDLHLLQRSKYVQPQTGQIYREVKEYLENEKPVLFCGCPCQIAGLYAFLGKDYKKLFTADLVCSYLPSHMIFDKFLQDNFSEEIESFDFRIKDKGWGCPYYAVSQKNAGRKIFSHSQAKYMTSYLRKDFISTVCEQCQYRSYTRVGDISIADYWQIVKYMPDFDDAKGTSRVFVNNKKGKQLFEKMKSKAQKSCQTEIRWGQILDGHSFASVARDRFFQLIQRMPFNKALDYALNRKFDIGLLLLSNEYNYGAVIIAYALYKSLKNMGYEVLQIGIAPGFNFNIQRQFDKISRAYKQLPFPLYDSMEAFPETNAVYQYQQLNSHCNRFVLGSDQIFYQPLLERYNYFSNAHFVAGNKKISSYGCSFGQDFYMGNEHEREELKYFLKRFDSFSVREKSGIDLCRENFGLEADCVLDPTLLLERCEYDKLAQSGVSAEEPFAMAYILDVGEKWKKASIKLFAEKSGYNVEYFADFRTPDMLNKAWTAPKRENIMLEDWLASIRDADFILSDSFHAVCFSIIYKKPFAILAANYRSTARFDTILELFGLENRRVYSHEEFEKRLPELLEPIDYDKVYSILEKEKERSLNYLKQAAEEQKTNRPFSDYDAALAVATHSFSELAKINRYEETDFTIKKQNLDWLKSGQTILWGSGKCTEIVLGIFERLGIDPTIVSIAPAKSFLRSKNVIYDVLSPADIKNIPAEAARVLVCAKNVDKETAKVLSSLGYEYKTINIFDSIDIPEIFL